MLGKLKEVNERFDVKCLERKSVYDGYCITTDKHDFHILIDNEQQCCESYGYFSSEDDFKSFIGKDLVEVYLTDKALNTIRVEEIDDDYEYREIQFVNFKFASGAVLQFAVYNAHNGYYGHDIIFVKDKEIFFEDTL